MRLSNLFALLFVIMPFLLSAQEPAPAGDKGGGLIAQVNELRNEIKVLREEYNKNRLLDVPPGTIIAFAGEDVPKGWALCDGNPYVVNDPVYTNLFKAIRYAYGGETNETFRVPDLKGRVIVGTGHGADLANRKLADKFGRETHVLEHKELPAGLISLNIQTLRDVADQRNSNITGFKDGPNFRGEMILGSARQTPFLCEGAHHNIMQPSLALNYIIKL